MRWSKNKKIITLIILGTIVCPTYSFGKVYALNNKTISNYTINNKQSVNDINNSSNIGSNLYVEGTIVNIDSNYITIEDESGQAILFIDTSITQELNVNDFIFANGQVAVKDEVNTLVISDSSNIGLVDTSSEDDTDDDTNTDDSNTDDNTNKGDDKNPTQGNQTQTKPGGGSTITIKPSTSVSSSTVTSSQMTQEILSTKTYSSRTPITISYDLSESQWNSIISALKEGSIKVKDIKDNKIRITKISQEYGDKIWIVNDPRMLDVEKEQVTVGTEIIENIDFTNYDITETKWNSYVEDIKEGTAKLKINDDDSLKIIYNKNGKTDYTITIEKLI